MTDSFPFEIQVAEVTANDQQEPDIDRPYDPMSHEAWELTSGLLKARLGEYHCFDRRSRYLVSPLGASSLGFQEEYPVNVYRDTEDNSVLAVNLVLKGVFIQGAFPIWGYTGVGIIGRKGPQAEAQFVEHIANVREPFSSWEPDLVDNKGREIGLGKATRVIKQLRQARRLLYLPDWIEHLSSQETTD